MLHYYSDKVSVRRYISTVIIIFIIIPSETQERNPGEVRHPSPVSQDLGINNRGTLHFSLFRLKLLPCLNACPSKTTKIVKYRLPLYHTALSSLLLKTHLIHLVKSVILIYQSCV